jgi:uncharacterized protein (TIGR02444 family)
MKLWDWALAAYARPGVEAACLTLQDEYGQCVSLLLWAAWATAEGHGLDEPTLAEAAGLARAWESRVIRPLRAARRALRAPAERVDASAQAALRERINADELAAERLLLESLEVIPLGDGPSATLRAAMIAAAGAWGPLPPETALESLVNAFSPP